MDIIIVSTIERATDRHEAFLGAALSPMCGIPESLIHFYMGPDGADYPDIGAVGEAAVADGFPWVEEYALGTRTEFVEQTRASCAQVWAYAQLLTFLVEQNLTGLIIWDSKVLGVPFSVFSNILTGLQDAEKEFYMWQLMLRGHPTDFRKITVDQTKQNLLMFDGIVRGNGIDPMAFLLAEGLNGYDESIVFSPAGAAWMLERLADADDFHFFLDHFICYELARYSWESDKGFYSPMDVSFKFVDAPRAMGTLTGWAHSESVHYEESRSHLKPRRLEL